MFSYCNVIQLEMDGKKVELPELEGIVVLNINSWCSGCDIWPDQPAEDCSASRLSSCFVVVMLLLLLLLLHDDGEDDDDDNGTTMVLMMMMMVVVVLMIRI